MTPEDKDTLKGLTLALLNRAQEFSRAVETVEEKDAAYALLMNVGSAWDDVFDFVAVDANASTPAAHLTMELEYTRYEELLEAEETHNRLYAGGVDNWEGYDSCFENTD